MPLTAEERAKNRERMRARYASRCRLLDAIKSTAGCVDCGTENPVVLEFDHVGEKSYNIGSLKGGEPRSVLLAEVMKCEVRCKNCHAIRHDCERRAAS